MIVRRRLSGDGRANLSRRVRAVNRIARVAWEPAMPSRKGMRQTPDKPPVYTDSVWRHGATMEYGFRRN